MKLGTLLLLFTSVCWATDSLFRVNIINGYKISPLMLVFFEHGLLVMVTGWVLIWQRRNFQNLGLQGWFSSLIIGVGGSAIALYAFTLSFRYINPSVTIILQKLHPVFAVSIAVIFLNEKITKHLLIWGTLALISGFVLSSAEVIKIMESARENSLASDPSAGLFGVLLALLAAIIWGFSTAASRYMAIKTGFAFSMSIRFFLGFLGLFIFILIGPGPQGIEFEWMQLTSLNGLPSLFYLAFISGLLAMSLYYYGLKTTKAQVATFIESLWPLFAAFLNWAVFGFKMEIMQIIFAVVLLISVYKIQSKNSDEAAKSRS